MGSLGVQTFPHAGGISMAGHAGPVDHCTDNRPTPLHPDDPISDRATACMNATEARQLLLIRAHELDPAGAAAWSDADRAWASAEASRLEGEHAEPDRWLARRASVAVGRLAQRAPAVASWARPAPAVPRMALVLTVVALGVGLASNAVGPTQRINLLAPPLLAVIVWNLAVYAGLLLQALRPSTGVAAAPAPGLLQRAGEKVSAWAGQHPALTGNPALQRFVQDWLQASRSLQTARFAAVLHLAAFALAAGALGGLYLHGLLLEFRAGWDSTFLSTETVQRWLSVLLGPAAALSGTPLPDAAQLEAIRFSRGPGENAARWIHLYAITTAVVVLLPRLGLAVAAAWQGRRLAQQFPIPLEDPYFQRLLQHLAHERRETALNVVVLPYSYNLAAPAQAGLAAVLADILGPGLDWRLLPVVPQGHEDQLDTSWPRGGQDAAAADAVVALFAMTATPERETHGRFLRAVQARCTGMPRPARCLVVIDESGFRQRLSGAELTHRLSQRRAAWQTLLDEAGLAGRFADLGTVPTAVSARA